MKYPIGVQSFDKLREAGFVYVDKTDLIYRLTHNLQYVFLGRPRRFGKSLLLSTIEAYFEGRRELFDGLAIHRLEKDWAKHAVLHFDLNTGDYRKSGLSEVESVLSYELLQYEKIYGGIDDTLSNRFKNLLQQAYVQTGHPVVVLVDEYDKPVLSAMNSEQEQEDVRGVLKSFYACLKSCDRYIRFAMLTGVSKFGKLSVFSDLNNIKDISLDTDYATICGLTRAEVTSYFAEPIADFATRLGVSEAEMLEKLRLKYDGYRFSPQPVKVFNPYSLLNAFHDKMLRDYWFETATPTFLVRLLKDNDYDLSNIEGQMVDESALYQTDNFSAIPMLYQTGYLTIKDYNPAAAIYTLGYPNQEVEASFLNFLLPRYSSVPSYDSRTELFKLSAEIKSGDIEAFMVRLRSILSSIPYSKDNSAKVQEDQFRNLVYLVFKLLGMQVHVECPMSRGRSDAVLWTDRCIYVIEFKIDSSPEDALAQIHTKGYDEPFRADGRQLILVGVNYSTVDRGLTGWLIKRE